MRAFFDPQRCRRTTAVVLLALLPVLAWANVPHRDAAAAYAEEQTILQAETDAQSPEPGLGSAASGRVHVDRHFIGQYGAGEGNVILQRGGNSWRLLRNGPLAAVSGTVILVVPLLLLGFYVAVGPSRTDTPASGRRLLRFTGWQRLIHWATAISFLILAGTGLIVLFGKKLLLPLIGHDAFSWVAAVSKYLHNFVGPLFIVCSVLLFLTFVRKNLFQRRDWQWIRQGGGLFSHRPIPAGFFNAGEKLWFWGGVALLGLLMSVTGLILDFVVLGQTRYVLQIADGLHIAGATLYIAAALGHIYIGTLGTPGSYEGMRHGTVDEAWAKTHHAIWYEQSAQGNAPGGDGTAPDGTRADPAHGPARPGPAL